MFPNYQNNFMNIGYSACYVLSIKNETSSSSMKLLKTYNRSTMTNNQLNTLAMLDVHLDLHPDSEDVPRTFIAIGLHRLDFHI